MELAIPGIETKVDELLTVLDEDIRHVRSSLSRLDELRSLVVKRDQAALGRLLEQIRAESQEYAKNESQRESMRTRLAADLECSIGDMTLSRLESVLGDDRRIEVAQRKELLRSLTEKLETEYVRTAMLLSDCARFNSVLLRGILELGGRGVSTYGSDGATRIQNDSIFVSLKY